VRSSHITIIPASKVAFRGPNLAGNSGGGIKMKPIRINFRTGLFGLASILFVCVILLSAETGIAQDVDPDAVCRTKSNLSVIPGVLSNAGYARNFDGSVNVGFILNGDHAMFEDSCDGDKFKIISSSNVCYSEQYATGFFTVIQCDCRVSSMLEVKVKFSQNYNVNGGFIDPRKKTITLFIDPTNQQGGFCSP
jgi:hypothetical protein